jgi:sugar lactone lactonase YvrE
VTPPPPAAAALVPGSEPRLLRAETAVAAGCQLAEGPVWDADRQLLLWVDILAGQVHTFDPLTGARTQFATGTQVGAVGLTRRGGLVLALRDGFALADAYGRGLTRLGDWRADSAAVRFNDGKPDPWGNFCAGTMQLTAAGPSGSLYRLSPDGAVTELVPGAAVSNGLDWTDDRRTFYYVDSATSAVDRFDCDPRTGALSGRRRFVQIAAGDGMPDGLTLDADGGVWVAIWGGGQVRRFTPAGALDVIVTLPVSKVSSVTFGGRDLSVLYITTAREDFTAADLLAEPQAGDIFRCTTGLRGRLPFRFAGA